MIMLLTEHRKRMSGPGDKTSLPVHNLFAIDPVETQVYDDLIMWKKIDNAIEFKVALPDMARAKLKKAEKILFVDYEKGARQNIFNPTLIKKLSLSESSYRKAIMARAVVAEGKLVDSKVERVYAFNQACYRRQYMEQALENPVYEEHEIMKTGVDLAKQLFRDRLGCPQGAVKDFVTNWGLDNDNNLLHLTRRPSKVMFVIQEIMTWVNIILTGYCLEQGYPLLYRIHHTDESAARFGLDPTEKESISSYYTLSPEINPAVHSHAGFTSPLRRFADAANLQIVSAALQGKDSPHSLDYLSLQAERLNEKVRTYQLKRWDSEPARLSRYYQFVNDSYTGKLFFPDRQTAKEELIKKIKLGLAGDFDLIYFIMINKKFPSVRQAALRYAKQHPERHFAILETGRDKDVWRMKVSRSFRGINKSFCLIKLESKKRGPLSATNSGKTYAEARQRAATIIFNKLANKPPGK